MLSVEELRSLCALSRLSLTPEEEMRFLKELNGIVGVFDALDKLAVPKHPEPNHIPNTGTREDVVRQSSIDPFSNAKSVEKGKFKAPKLVD